MTKEVFSRVLDYKTGLTGASVLSALTIKYGAFQGFICQDYTVVQVITDAQGNDVTAQMGLRGVTLSPGIYISMASGDSIYSIILSSGSIILYDLGADMSSVPGVSDLITAFSTRASVDGATLESTSCIDGPLMPYFKKASFYLTPSAYKGGKLYAQKPITGNGDLTWVRGGDAFRTNSSGLVQRTPWNLLQGSEAFETWTKINVTISANSTTAPNGTLTADTMTPDATNTTHRVNFLGSAGTAGYTLSVFAKSNGYNFLQIAGGVNVDHYGNFNLSTGVVTQTGLGTIASIANVGNDWYRCSITIPAISGANILIAVVNSGTSGWQEAFTANGTSGIYIWGAQLVEGTTAQTYLPTTDRLGFPRLDYTYGTCPAALLEPQRTNLVTYSNDFTNAVWSKSGATVTANTTVSPDGNTNASTIVFSGTDKYVTQGCLTLGTNVTTSVWIKGTSGETITVACGGTDQVFTLNGSWQRLSVNRASTTNIYTNINTFLGATARTIYVYGFQAEIGSYPTTYIPTTSATATRVADSFSRNNIYTNGLISASGGTWFVELRGNVAYTRDGSGFLGIGDTSALTTNSLVIFCPSTSSRLQIAKFIATVGTTLYTTTTDTVKIAVKWNGTSADVFANGTKVVSATLFTTTNMEFLQSSIQVPTFIQQMALFPTPLSDTECAAMTTI